MQWDWAGLYDVCQCSSQGSMQYMSSCLRSVYLFVFGYFVQRRESMCGFLIVFGCLKFLFCRNLQWNRAGLYDVCQCSSQGFMQSTHVQLQLGMSTCSELVS